MNEAASILTKHFAANPQPEMGARGKAEWRTQARALQAFAAYRERYAGEDWEVLGVEEPCEAVLGEFKVERWNEDVGAYESVVVTVVVRGIRDLRVRWHDSL